MKPETEKELKDVLIVIIAIVFLIAVLTATFYFLELKAQQASDDAHEWWEITENATETSLTSISQPDTYNFPLKNNMLLETNYGGLYEF